MKRDVVVQIGQVSNVPIPLEVTGRVETIEITTAAPLLSTETQTWRQRWTERRLRIFLAPGRTSRISR